jgi:rare lipoprotein A
LNQYQTEFPGTCTILKKPSAPVFIILSVVLIFQSCSVAPRYTIKHPEEKRKITPPSEKKSKPFDEKIETSKKPQSGGSSSDDKAKPAEKSPETPAQNSETIFQQTGLASYYANNLQGHRTANGERYDKNDFTAAHLTLPFNTTVKVTNVENDLSVKVRINDRGPHSKSRIIDLSRAAAEKIGLIRSGICKVRIEKVE